MAFGFGSKKRRIEETKRARREEKRRKRQNKPPVPGPFENMEGPPAETGLPEEPTLLGASPEVGAQ